MVKLLKKESLRRQKCHAFLERSYARREEKMEEIIEKLQGFLQKLSLRSDRIKSVLTNKLLMSLFAGAVALIAIVSVATLIGEKRSAEPESTAPVMLAMKYDTAGSAPQELKASFLLAVCSESERKVRLIACLSADSEKGNFEITYIPSSQRCEVNSTEGSIEEHYKSSGCDGLIWAVRACTGKDVDRYIIVDEKDAADIFKIFGEQDINVPHEVRHDYNGISFIINEGTQKLSADNIAKYLSYLCDSGAEEQDSITGLVSHYLRLSFETDDGNTLESRFDSLVNLVKTDISAMDIAAYGALLSSFLE